EASVPVCRATASTSNRDNAPTSCRGHRQASAEAVFEKPSSRLTMSVGDHFGFHWLHVTVRVIASYFPVASDSTVAWTACPPSAGHRDLMGPESSTVALTGTASRPTISTA